MPALPSHLASAATATSGRRRLTRRLITMMCALLLAVGLATPAHAASPFYEYTNATSYWCLGADHADVVYVSYKCTHSSYQSWWGAPLSVSTRINVATGRCLDSNAAGKVYTLPCNGGANQKWRTISPGWDDYDWLQIENVATGMCLFDNTFAYKPGVDLTSTGTCPSSSPWGAHAR
jgi:hypothetical protein